MANIKSGAKNARKAIKRHKQSVSVKSELKTFRKKALLAAEAKAENTTELTNKAVKKLAKAASNKYIHPRTASRKISRLMRAVNRLQAAE